MKIQKIFQPSPCGNNCLVCGIDFFYLKLKCSQLPSGSLQFKFIYMSVCVRPHMSSIFLSSGQLTIDVSAKIILVSPYRGLKWNTSTFCCDSSFVSPLREGKNAFAWIQNSMCILLDLLLTQNSSRFYMQLLLIFCKCLANKQIWIIFFFKLALIVA